MSATGWRLDPETLLPVPTDVETFRRHLGKVHLVAGDLGAAEACFAAALALHEEIGAAQDLVASSRLAVTRVEALRAAGPPH